jgi:hypothetical protein
MVTPRDLLYPAVAMNARGFLYEVRSAPDLERCNSLALKRDYFNRLQVIDQSCTEYRVVCTRNPRVIKGGLLLRLIGNPIMRVDLDLMRGETLSLAQAKAKIGRAVGAHPELWDASEEDEEILQRIEAATSMSDLCRIFAGRA